MSGDLLLALDLGTTGVRALAVDLGGRVRGRAYRPLATRFPAPGRVEQDPEELVAASASVLAEVLAAARAGARDVLALGLASQRATALAWDARTGRALAPALSWQDQRTAERAAALRAQGIPISTLPTATKLEWLLANQPAVRGAAAAGRLRLGTPDAWLGARLASGDAHVTDPGQASCTALYDLQRGTWNAQALAFFGIDESALPRIVATAAVVGETRAGLLGAPVPLAARAGDQQAACFGQGALAPGDAALTLGTAAILDVHTGGEIARAPAGAFPLALWRIPGGDAFCLEATVVTAGALVDWLVTIGLLPEASALDRVAGSVDDAAGAVCVPALQGLGTPFGDERARGLLGGLTRGTRAAHVVRAAVDGIAHRCTDLLDALGAEGAVRVDGGLARSGLLLQRLADLSGRAILRAAEIEATALGAAFLAGLGAGAFATARDAAALRAPSTRSEPRLAEEARARARARWAVHVARARSSFEAGTAVPSDPAAIR